MNQLTVVDRGAVKHPEIVTIDEAQNLLDQYGVGGQAVKIPDGVNLQKFLGRCKGGWYYDDASVSGSVGGPVPNIVYYNVINGGTPGNRGITAISRGNELWVAEVYGDVFRGWVNFARPADVHQWISDAITAHENTRNHPYATEADNGFVRLATSAEAVTGSPMAVLTALRAQNLLDTYGLGANSLDVPNGANLATYFIGNKPGFYRLGSSVPSGYVNVPGDAPFGWAEVIVTNHDASSRSMILITNTGRTYTATNVAGSFSGWKLKLQMEDLPIASSSQQGIVRLVDSISSVSTTDAATPNSVRVVNDNANSRVPQTRMVNGFPLTSDVYITPANLGVYTKAEVNALLAGLGTVQDIRWGSEGTSVQYSDYVNYLSGRKSGVPVGAVMTNLADNVTDKNWIEDIDTVWWRYLQKQVGGVWYNVGAI